MLANQELLEGLRKPTEQLLNRHFDNAKEWYPHELAPWSIARNFTDADPWSPDEHPLAEGVRSALYVNLLTEDNLPFYTWVIMGHAPKDHPLNEFFRRWTAEEGRHAIVIRDWVTATRALDPKWLEDGRMVQVAGGVVPEPDSLEDMLVYTSFQELATQVAHTNTGRKLGKEREGFQVMARVAGDEALHHRFYRDATAAALEISPSSTVRAIAKQLDSFDMPGTGIPRFRRHAVRIARAGIYNPYHYFEKVVKPTLDAWQLSRVDELDADGEQAIEQIDARVVELKVLAERYKPGVDVV